MCSMVISRGLCVVWRVDELRTINETTSGPERKAALCGLLEQEAQLIASIGKHKIEAGKEHQKKAVERFLDAVSSINLPPTSSCRISLNLPVGTVYSRPSIS